MNKKRISTKRYDGFSTCFRQWRADGTHCQKLHGYDLYFKVRYEGELDEKNWVFDFGRLKRSNTLIDGKNPKVWLDWLLDHTVLMAEDDPELEIFKQLDDRGALSLRTLPQVGIECLAEYLYVKLNDFVKRDTENRVEILDIEVFEHEKNSAIFTREMME